MSLLLLLQPQVVVLPYHYTWAGVTTIPTDDSNLANSFTSTNYTNVATVDSVFFDEAGGSTYNVQLYKYQDSNNTDTINVSWTGKSTVACSTATTNLEIYNYATPAWESLSTNTTTAAGTAITLTGSKTGSNYYTTGDWVAVRVWQ